MIMWAQHLKKTAPLELGRTKIVQNSVRLTTTIDTDCKYSTSGTNRDINKRRASLTPTIFLTLNKKISEPRFRNDNSQLAEL